MSRKMRATSWFKGLFWQRRSFKPREAGGLACRWSTSTGVLRRAWVGLQGLEARRLDLAAAGAAQPRSGLGGTEGAAQRRPGGESEAPRAQQVTHSCVQEAVPRAGQEQRWHPPVRRDEADASGLESRLGRKEEGRIRASGHPRRDVGGPSADAWHASLQ